MKLARSMSSKPTTDTLSGTEIPACLAACMKVIATRSLAQKIAVTLGFAHR